MQKCRKSKDKKDVLNDSKDNKVWGVFKVFWVWGFAEVLQRLRGEWKEKVSEGQGWVMSIQGCFDSKSFENGFWV